jgi:hypothetical protein
MQCLGTSRAKQLPDNVIFQTVEPNVYLVYLATSWTDLTIQFVT